jgi:hypoxanthine-guanine phosphoribosyltransferase
MQNCEHKRLSESKRQIAIKNTLLIADCLDCGTTITVGTDAHTEAEAAKIAAIAERLAQRESVA